MKARFAFLLMLLRIAIAASHAQGTFVYDQESSADETPPLGGGPPIQYYGTVGQSFIPSLSTVGFVRLKLYDAIPGNTLGATVVVKLRADAIDGTVLGTSIPANMSDGFADSISFFFVTPVPVTASETYFLEPVVQSGDFLGFTLLGDTYPTGTAFVNGLPYPGNSDIWFREGIIVPEPSSLALLFCGGVVAVWSGRRSQRRWGSTTPPVPRRSSSSTPR